MRLKIFNMSKRQLNHIALAREFAAARTAQATCTMNAIRFVFSILVEGSSYAQASRIIAWNDI